MSNWLKHMGAMFKQAATARAIVGKIEEQEIALIPGMPNAPEACCLPQHYEAARHPANAIVQLKVHGIRGIATPGRIVTREALPFNAALHCRPDLDRLETLYGEPMVFDGEYQEEEGFEATLSAFRKGVGAGVFWVFDAVPYSEWVANEFKEPLHRRVARLEMLVASLASPFVGCPGSWVLNADDTLHHAQRLWMLGYEGVVVKDADSKYTRGRSWDWMKLKERVSLDVIIKDCVVKNGRVVSLLCDHVGRIVKVTSGIPEALRVEIARCPHGFTGRMVEITHTDTSSKGGLIGVSFGRMRDDRMAGGRP